MSARLFGGRDIVVAALIVSLALAYSAAIAPLLAIAALVGIVFLVCIVARPEWILLVVVAALPWQDMLQYPSPTLSLVKLLGLALAAAFVLQISRGGRLLRVSPTLVFALLFGLVVGLSLLASPEVSSGLTKGFRYAFYIAFLFLATQMVDNREQAQRLIRVLVASAALAGLYGCLNFVSGAVNRASGPIADANDFAYMMAAVLPLSLYLAKEERQWRAAWTTTSLLLLAATFATLSRGALVGLAALLLWAILTRRIGIGGTVAISVASLLIIGAAVTFWSSLIEERLTEKNHIGAANVESRAAFWSAAERMAIDHPLLGVGPERFRVEAKDYVRNSPLALEDPIVHNSYLEILAEDGPLALLLFLGMLGAAWVGATRAERQARAHQDVQTARLATAVKATLLVATVAGIFLSQEVAPPFWLACALAGCGALYVPRGASEPSGEPPLGGAIVAA